MPRKTLPLMLLTSVRIVPKCTAKPNAPTSLDNRLPKPPNRGFRPNYILIKMSGKRKAPTILAGAFRLPDICVEKKSVPASDALCYDGNSPGQ